MITCPVCSAQGRRRPRNLLERIVNRAKFQCNACTRVWYWRRTLFQRYTRCPECGTLRLAKRGSYDMIDRRSKSFARRFLAIFGAPIYHCTFCRLQFRDVRGLDPNRRSKVQFS